MTNPIPLTELEKELLEALKKLVPLADIDDKQPPSDAVFPYDSSSQSDELSEAIKTAKDIIAKAEKKS